MTTQEIVLETATLKSCADELLKIATTLNTPILRGKVERVQEKFDSGELTLIVVGEFKRGKSSLINALIGADVMPVGVAPITSIITVLRHGPKPQVHIEFENQSTTSCEIAELSSFVSERENPKNVKAVKQAIVEHPAAILKGLIRIVDTPGIGSVYKHNTDVTEQYLPQADAAIFVLASDQPATQAELSFLKHVRQHSAKFFFVQNKCDNLTDNEALESRNFVTQAIEEQLGRPIKLYQVSARRARLSHDANFDQFKNELVQFFQNERIATLGKATAIRLLSLALEAKDFTTLRLQSASLSSREAGDAVQEFEQALRSLEVSIETAEHLITGRSKRLVEEMSASLNPFVENATPMLDSWLTDYLAKYNNLSSGELHEQTLEALKVQIAVVLSPWREEQEHKLKEQFKVMTDESINEANQIFASLSALTQKLFQCALTINLEVPQFTDKVSTYFKVDDPFTLSMQALPLLLSGPFAKSLIKREFAERAGEELRRNGGRLRADFQRRVEESVRHFLAEFRIVIRAEFKQIQDFLNDALALEHQNKANLGAQETALQEVLSHLKSIETSLGAGNISVRS